MAPASSVSSKASSGTGSNGRKVITTTTGPTTYLKTEYPGYSTTYSSSQYPGTVSTTQHTTQYSTGGAAQYSTQCEHQHQTSPQISAQVRHISGQQYQTSGQYLTGQVRQISGQQYQTAGSTLTNGRYISSASIANAKYELAREVSAHTLTGQETVIGERIVEHEIKVPKKIIREDIVEKVIVVPEKIVHEEIVEEIRTVRERIIEVAKPVYQEKIVEVPEYEYVQKIVEVVEKRIQEKIKEVPRVEIQERIIHVPKIITQERVVEVPEIEYREIPVEKVVEMPEVREQVIIKEVIVPQYVDKPIPEHVTVEVPQKVERNIPIPVEAVTTFQYRLPHIRPHYKKSTFPLYVPRFIEVPVPDELVTGQLGEQAQNLAKHVALLTSQTAPSLCEIENIASDIKRMDLASHIASADYHRAIEQLWSQGKLNIITSDKFVASRGISGSVNDARHVPVVYQNPSIRKASSRVSHNKSVQSGRKSTKSAKVSTR